MQLVKLWNTEPGNNENFYQPKFASLKTWKITHPFICMWHRPVKLRKCFG